MTMIYVDHSATSPTHPEVVKEMLPYFTEKFGNPSSIHAYGRQTRGIVDQARKVVAKSIHAKEREIIFTSGGTEADNTAIIGVALANKAKGNHIITSSIEHHAILHTCEFLEQQGFKITYLPVDETGRVSIEDVKAAYTEDTILVSVMFGNNEVGTLQPIQEIGEWLKDKPAFFHTDAVQAFGVLKMDVQTLHVDLLSVSAHKFNGPKGVGFLYARDGVKLFPFMHGGDQERKRRAGTENVPGIAGLKKAVEIAQKTMDEKASQYEHFRQIMLNTFEQSGIHYVVNGNAKHHLPHILNVSFPNVKAESMLVNLDLEGIAASSGSACTAGSIDPSHVLVQMFKEDEARILSAIRFSFGYGNTEEQIQHVATTMANIVLRLQK